jgi:hypothetical protein
VSEQCAASVPYATEQSGRRMADGKKRYLKGPRCQKRGIYVDRDGDYWCHIHAENPNVIADYGPLSPPPSLPKEGGGA